MIDADLHNFNNFTSLSEGKIVKRRNCLQEYVFLGEGSTFRTFINRLYPEAELLPGLRFFGPYQDGPHLGPVEMEFLQVQECQGPLSNQESRQVGAFVALAAYFGLSDCHRYNLVVGHRNGQFIFSSMDWETLLSPIPSVFDLAFFRAPRGCDCPGPYCKSYGLKEVTGLADVAQVLEGHLRMVRTLKEKSEGVNALFQAQLEGKRWTRRAVIRNTVDYLPFLGKGSQEFYPEENIQLLRGEIPYFFQLGDKLFYWISPEAFEPVATAHWPLPEELLHSPGIQEETETQLVRQIARSLDSGEDHREFRSENFCVTYKNQIVYVDGPGVKTFARRIN